MIGVINPNSTQTLDAQMVAAARADFQVAPGEPIPKEGSETPSSTKQHLTKLSTGEIIGIVIGSIALLIFCMWLLWYVLRHRSRRDFDSRSRNPHTHVSVSSLVAPLRRRGEKKKTNPPPSQP